MTIVYLFDSLICYGGIERILTDKMNYLAEHYDYNIIIVTYCQGSNNTVYDLSPKVKLIDVNVPIQTRYKYHHYKRVLFCLKMYNQYYSKVRNILKENNVDVLVATTQNFFILSVVYRLRKIVKTVIESHIYSNWGHLYKKKGIARSIYYFFKLKLFKLYVRKSTIIVSLTERDKNIWKDAKGCIVIPNMLRLYPKENNKEGYEYKRIISVGRIDFQKGFDLLLEAWRIVTKKHPVWHLDIFGDGDSNEKEKLEQLCEDYKLQDALAFHKPTNNIYNQYMTSDFCVMSSRYEGFGMVLIEAMSCGIPCISFDCPYGPSEVIKDNEDGFLVPSGDTKALAEKICFLIENKDIRNILGKNARKDVKRFLPQRIMPLWKRLFEHLVVS